MNEEAKKVFTPGTMIFFRSARKLSSYLVKVKTASHIPSNELQDHLNAMEKGVRLA